MVVDSLIFGILQNPKGMDLNAGNIMKIKQAVNLFSNLPWLSGPFSGFVSFSLPCRGFPISG